MTKNALNQKDFTFHFICTQTLKCPFVFFHNRASTSTQAKPKHPEESVPPPESSQKAPSIKLPPPPGKSFQLEADLRAIGNQPEVVYRYLKVGFSEKKKHTHTHNSKQAINHCLVVSFSKLSQRRTSAFSRAPLNLTSSHRSCRR